MLIATGFFFFCCILRSISHIWVTAI